MTWLGKFKKFWRSLSDEEQNALYTVMTAIRGPDTSNLRFKSRTTARIRYELFGEKRKSNHSSIYGGCYTRSKIHEDMHPITRDEFYNATKIGLSTHFLSHTKFAIFELAKVKKKKQISDLLELIRE